MWLVADSIVIPLEQGLRQTFRQVPSASMLFYRHSIRTRIKTVYFNCVLTGVVHSIVIPLEQGLRQTQG